MVLLVITYFVGHDSMVHGYYSPWTTMYDYALSENGVWEPL